MTKYVLNIIYEDNSHTSLAFNTYEEADEYITSIFENEHFEGNIVHWDINEVEV
jgi:hypothetical protein